jgi:hypothetical protein
MSIIQSAGIFVPDLKIDPHINFYPFRGVLFNEAMNTENAIRKQYGLLFNMLLDLESCIEICIWRSMHRSHQSLAKDL